MHWKTKRRRTDWRLYQLVFQCMGTNVRISAEPAACFGVTRQVISVSGGLLLGA